MFSQKLKYYDKSCKWMLFLLNIWWPLLIVLSAWNVIQCIIGWTSSQAVTLMLSLALAIVLIAADLIARFLDKTAYIAILAAEGVMIAYNVAVTVDTYAAMRAASGASQMAGTGVGIIDAGAGIASGIVGAATGFVFAAAVVVAVARIAVAAATIAYVCKRKDLFLTGEKALRKGFEE